LPSNALSVHLDQLLGDATKLDTIHSHNQALDLRHQIAHGVNPRPIIHNPYSNWLPGFIRRLALCTDDGVRNHLTAALGLPNPWPP
jgi:hypothetical protein